MNTRQARILVQGGGEPALCFAPVNLREVIRAFPSRRWDDMRCCWLVPMDQLDVIADVLRATGCEVFVTLPDGEPWIDDTRPHGARSTPADSWADNMFATLDPERHGDVYRGLARELSYDDAFMRELNAASIRAHQRTAARGQR